MRDIREFGSRTSAYELLAHLYERILAGSLETFEALRAYGASLPDDPRTRAVLKRAFELQRRLHWGFFKDLSPEAFPRLWSAIVMADPTHPQAGDLKRFMSIPDIYLGFLDIHGYTRFCRKNRHNMSTIDLLDRMIQEEVPRIAAGFGVLSRRTQGDQILLLGASAGDVLEAVLLVTEYLAGRYSPEGLERGERRAGSDGPLPTFDISAGIAGGQKYTPLVITRDGDLSGDIVNTAARLQARAGKISPDHTRILVTSHVYQRLKAAGGREGRELLAGVDFVNSGTVEFKGVSLAVYDTVFLRRESWRLAYAEALEGLYDALDKNAWTSRVFETALRLAAKVAMNLPSFAQETQLPDGRQVDRDELLARCRAALSLWSAEAFERAAAGLAALVEDFESLETRDDLALEYLRSVRDNYGRLLAAYAASLDAEIEARPETVFNPQDQASYRTLEKHHGMFETARDKARERVRNRKLLWVRVADELGPGLDIALKSLK